MNSTYEVYDKKYYHTRRGKCWYTCGRKPCPDKLKNCLNCYYLTIKDEAWYCRRKRKAVDNKTMGEVCKQFYCLYMAKEFPPWEGIRTWWRKRKEQRKGMMQI